MADIPALPEVGSTGWGPIISEALTDINDEQETGRLSESALSDTIGAQIETDGSAANHAVVAVVDDKAPSAASTAIDALITSGSVPASEMIDEDEFSVRFDDSAEPFVAFRELDESQGWGFAVIGNDDKVVFGQRTDGTWYPPSLTPSTLTPIVRWGDSLTANAAVSAAQLSTALGGRPVFTNGIGGQTSQQIAARNGGVPTRVTVTGGIIPASGSVGMTLTIKLRSDSTGSYPIVVAGVSGQFQAADSSPSLVGTFTRDVAGLPAVVPAGTPATTGYPYRNYWPILWAGRNNFKNTGDSDQIVSDLRGMLEWSTQREHALILSIPPWVGEEDGNGAAPRTSYRDKLDLANSSIRDAFPREYVDTSVRLRNADVITATGNTPTTQDLADIANGLTPTTFRTGSDGVTVDDGHLGPIGYTALYTIIAEIYKSRGWNS